MLVNQLLTISKMANAEAYHQRYPGHHEHHPTYHDILAYYQYRYSSCVDLTEEDLANIPTRQPRLHALMVDNHEDPEGRGRLRRILRMSKKVWSTNVRTPHTAKFVCCLVNPYARESQATEAHEFIPFTQHSAQLNLNTGVINCRMRFEDEPDPPPKNQYALCRVMLAKLRGLPEPENGAVDHLCGRRHCVNPYHMIWQDDAVSNERRCFCPGVICLVNIPLLLGWGDHCYFSKCQCDVLCRYITVLDFNESVGHTGPARISPEMLLEG